MVMDQVSYLKRTGTSCCACRWLYIPCILPCVQIAVFILEVSDRDTCSFSQVSRQPHVNGSSCTEMYRDC